jgi:hypothetical protein
MLYKNVLAWQLHISTIRLFQTCGPATAEHYTPAKVDFSTSKAMKVISVCAKTFTKLAGDRTLSFIAQVVFMIAVTANDNQRVSKDATSNIRDDAAKTRTRI